MIALCLALVSTFSGVESFAPVPSVAFQRASSSQLAAKYKNMDEILALFPEDTPVLINFYDSATEKDIKDDIFRAKTLLKDRATLVSIKVQDYPELAKLWDCADKSPAMILFKDGSPVTRLYGESHYLEIVAKFGALCK
jgi:thioredoxin-like negative regulator of GroEL